tara:strand:+ start:4970 stop:6658 length:1689 start_codon:yes stop_codon:yes gene_type:complete
VVEGSAAEKDLLNWRRYRGRMGEDAKRTPVYKMKLSGPVPDKLTVYPKNLRTGTASRGEALLRGHWNIGRDRLDVGQKMPPWSRSGPSRHYADRLHRFQWLNDLIAHSPEGQRFGRDLITDWVQQFGKWNGFVWRIPVTAERVWNWLVGGPNFLENRAPESEVLASLARQARHLQFGTPDCDEPRAVLKSLFAQMAYAFAAEEGDRRIAGLESQIEFTLNDQILADGGHVSRNPEALLEILIDLQTIDDLYLRTGRPTLGFINKLVPRIAGMLKFLRCSDGGLPIMNGGSEGRRIDLKNALFPYSGARAFAFATKSGIQKMEAGKSRLLLDAGHAPSIEYGHEAHAGCLAFEFEDHGERIVTNCGSHRDVDPVWQAATRRTDGHSTLVLTGHNSAHFVPVRLLGVDAPTGPPGISAKRMEEQNEIMIDAQHAGWKDEFGLIFRRRLFMAPDGQELRGEDSLFRPVSAGQSENTDTIPYDVRFHLHPSVRLSQDGEHLRIILPSGTAWQFQTTHKRKAIERSVYLARGTVEKCWQMVLSSDADPNGDASMPSNIIKWSFVKMD